MIKRIKEWFISASIFMGLGLLSAIAVRYLENAPSSVPIVISLMFVVGGLWMALRPKSIAKRWQDKRGAYINKHGRGEFVKQLEESSGYKDLAIEMRDPKYIRNLGILTVAFFFNMCSYFFIIKVR